MNRAPAPDARVDRSLTHRLLLLAVAVAAVGAIGIPAHATYGARSGRVRTALRELGVGLLLDDERAYGATLTSFRLPAGKTYEALHARLKQDGLVIYAGHGKFDGAIFRIAVMGEITERDLDRLGASLRAALG
jgi:2-aminoethylphosphonate-pyruvate transaminase